MSTRASESHLRTLRRLAYERARERKETPTTIHLLAATWSFGGPARRLLEDRRLDEAKLLSAARAFDETLEDALEEALFVARGLARRGAVPSQKSFRSTHGDVRPAAPPEPSAIHVLQVLVSNRRYAAYRALSQCGVDIVKLRSAATRIVLGVVAPPRKGRHDAVREARELRARRAVQVPLIPPMRARIPSTPQTIAEMTLAKAAPREVEIAESPPPPEVMVEPEVEIEVLAPPRKRMTDDEAFDELWLDEDDFPTLAPLRNLTLEAATGQLGPSIAREREVEQTLDVLAKHRANNPLLVGPAGVGKTTIARAVAKELLDDAEDERRVLLELPPSELLSGTAARGSLAERLQSLRREVAEANGRVVLFIDEIHELLGSGALDEVSGELKDALAAGELPIIATTTPEAYRRCVESDAALARRFGVVEVSEPAEADAFLMLQAASEGLADHHGVSYTDEAIAVSVSWSIRYLPGRALPDKALAVLDLAGARLARRGETAVGIEDIAAVMAERADVPLDRLLQTDGDRMLELSATLKKRVVGHDAECDRIAAVLRRNAAGLRGCRPIGTFLLLGPTGVGKTEMAKAVAEALFHSPEAMTRLDMSEYAEAHAVARLIGAPPGYVGHEAGGMLTEALRKRPYQVVLLDEIEKAHRDVLQSFLQVFDEGRMTDGRGRTVDFTHAVIVLTSNLGSSELRAAASERRVGFGQRAHDPTADTDRMRKIALDAARKSLPPELYNRIDEVMFFAHLSRNHVRAVARRLLNDLRARLASRGIRLEIDAAAIDALLEQGGYDVELGARPLRRAVVRLIEAPLADLILRGELADGAVALVGVEDGTLIVDSVAPRKRKRRPA